MYIDMLLQYAVIMYGLRLHETLLIKVLQEKVELFGDKNKWFDVLESV